MKLKDANLKSWKNHLFLLAIFLLFSSPLKAQQYTSAGKEIEHSVYITANTATAADHQVLRAIAAASENDDDATLLLMGNVTPKEGYLNEGEDSLQSQEFLQTNLFNPLEEFNGEVVIGPGANEWNSGAPQSIDDLESFLQDTGGYEFWPNDGCPLERESLSDMIELISVDSQWFLEDWDQRPEINSDCKIRTREDFFVEFKDDLKDSHGKIALVAVHHPIFSESRIPFVERVVGAAPESYQNPRQEKLRDRLETLASLFDDVIFISGDHKNLQFVRNERNPQIISGAAGITEPVRKADETTFASENRGFAKLVVYEDGSSDVLFYELKKGDTVLTATRSIERERPEFEELNLKFPELEDEQYAASIYTPEETDKGDLYEWLWGDRYRGLYSRKITAPVLYLDSLPENVRPISEGGGQQSRSLRLINDDKNEFTLRAMRKDPIQYLQADLIKDEYIGKFAQNTVAERYISDFFTTAHPYAPFAVNELSTALDIPHANPKIYYVPKQKGLGIYNEDYGNALFMLEEHVGDENKEFATFGSPDNILSTDDLLVELRESKDSYVDQDAYLRSRLFDMLIGDWDRHQDQWRWALHKKQDERRFVPIPRDRDHAFSKYDGPMMALLKSFIPLLRKMQSYGGDLESTKWFNWSGYPLDQRFITTANWEDWKEQALYIQEHLTDQKISAAFETLPEEIQDQDLQKLKELLRKRRANLVDLARRYYEYFQEFQTITGTEEDDTFQIERKPNGFTEISIATEDEEVFRNSYNSEETDEIWIYGLDGDDKFHLKGGGEDLIDLKILGGEEEDTYDFENPKAAKLYDYKSTESKIINPESDKWLVDSYEINRYNYKKRKYSVNKVVPIADYVSDAGLTVGVKDVYTTYGIARNPFSSRYVISGQYFFSSNGYQLKASAEYGHVFYNWNFRFAGLYSSPNYFINYFGSGSDAPYDRDAFEKNYHRVKLEQWEIKPSLIWRNDSGSFFSAGPFIESVEAAFDSETFLAEHFSPDNEVFDSQLYAGAEAHFNYLNKNRPAFPSLGTELDLILGYKENIDQYNNRFGYLRPSVSVDYPLIESGYAVIASKIGGEVIFGDNYEFYHGATLGGNRSLRGYRNHRFNGKQSFFHSTDLRTALGKVRTNFIPFVYGVTAGFDYGRVWTEENPSDKWHSNYGGSVWISAALAVTGSVGFYHGDDGNRITLSLNFKY